MSRSYALEIVYLFIFINFYFMSFVMFAAMYQRVFASAIPIIEPMNSTIPLQSEPGRKIEHLNTLTVFSPVQMFYSATLPEHDFPHYY